MSKYRKFHNCSAYATSTNVFYNGYYFEITVNHPNCSQEIDNWFTSYNVDIAVSHFCPDTDTVMNISNVLDFREGEEFVGIGYYKPFGILVKGVLGTKCNEILTNNPFSGNTIIHPDDLITYGDSDVDNSGTFVINGRGVVGMVYGTTISKQREVRLIPIKTISIVLDGVIQIIENEPSELKNCTGYKIVNPPILRYYQK